MIGIYLPGSLYSILFLLYSWGSLFGVPSRVPLVLTKSYPRAPNYLNSRLLGYVTIGYMEPSSHYLGNWSPRAKHSDGEPQKRPSLLRPWVSGPISEAPILRIYARNRHTVIHLPTPLTPTQPPHPYQRNSDKSTRGPRVDLFFLWAQDVDGPSRLF